MFKQMAGVDMVHVPYKGAGPALTDLLSRQHPGDVRHARHGAAAGQGRIAAAARRSVRRKRIADLPDVPTIAESGYPDYRVSVWYGVCGAGKDCRTISRRRSAPASTAR